MADCLCSALTKQRLQYAARDDQTDQWVKYAIPSAALNDGIMDAIAINQRRPTKGNA